ncbi:MAG: ribosome biogenesis GTP-binding protein YihA/YsxC [Flavobacteriaceae bacterium]
MQLKSATFVVSNTDVAKCPQHSQPEYAFIGRSNVGKSSLINALLQHKGLAKTSSRPGKTQLINHFLINDFWYLVDLPGYGYARVSKTQKKQFQGFITRYFERRKELFCAFVLIDIRHEPQSIDVAFMEWLGQKQIPFAIVFTKSDKLKPKQLETHVKNYEAALLESAWAALPPVFITSATNKAGCDELLDYIEGLNQEFKGLQKP